MARRQALRDRRRHVRDPPHAHRPGAVRGDDVTAPPVPTLGGRRCTLRALRPADAPALQRHADDPAVAFNLFDGFPQPYTLAAAQAWCSDEQREARFGHVWAIEIGDDGHDGEAAGCISVAPQGGIWACSAEIGYWLGRAHWRRGIVSEALGLVTDWAWGALPQVMRLQMPIYARNAASRGVARKAGYAQESFVPFGILKNGQAIDGTVYAAYRPGLVPRTDAPAP
ncbi:MAG: GNAT family N-acetyltransferase [Leptothrix sp. (in: Bacteria)]|nr:GNAT family N-acetyltransferase [Leptothrix sp. (in: b-proteobacteria)]